MKGFGHKSAIGRDLALHQTLSAILECIRQGVRSHVAHWKPLALLDQNKIDPAGEVLYGADLDVASYTEALMLGGAAQGRDLRDRAVVRLALLSSNPT